LARRGADIALGDILDPPQAKPQLQQIRDLGRRCRYDRVDVSDAAAVSQWVAAAEREFGVPTLVIPNAAIVHTAGVRELTAEEWRHELAVNLDGAFHLAQSAALRLLHRRKPGRVVFIGSWAGHVPHPAITAYCVSKAGLRMLCRCMAAELAEHGILVNEVAPGYVNAGLSGKVFRQDPKLREKSTRSVPVRELIDPAEVAVQVARLCEPDNRHFAGATLVMDGGLSLFGPGGQRHE
jgi:glucose 1-dehydrogenase